MPPGARVAVTTRSCRVVAGLASSAAKAVKGVAAASASMLALRRYLGMEPPVCLRLNDKRRASLRAFEPIGRRPGGEDAEARHTGPVETALHRFCSSLRRSSAPRIPLIRKLERHAQTGFLARGSWRHTRTFPDPSVQWLARGSRPPADAYALTAHSCRDSRRSGEPSLRPAFPFKPEGIGALGIHPQMRRAPLPYRGHGGGDKTAGSG